MPSDRNSLLHAHLADVDLTVTVAYEPGHGLVVKLDQEDGAPLVRVIVNGDPWDPAALDQTDGDSDATEPAPDPTKYGKLPAWATVPPIGPHVVRYRTNPSTGPLMPVVDQHPEGCPVETCPVDAALVAAHAAGATPWVDGLYRVAPDQRGQLAGVREVQ